MKRIVRTYELMTIFRPELAETDVRTEFTTVETALAARGAEIESADFWGKRRLAYEIRHVSEGYYTLLTFKAEAEAVADVDRALSLSDNVLRHKFIKPE